VVVALAGLTVGLFLQAAAKEEQVKARKTAEEKEEEANDQREKTRRILYIAHMNLVQREYEENNIARVRELLREYAFPLAADKDLRGFEWYF
jgi:hypothetical protein